MTTLEIVIIAVVVVGVLLVVGGRVVLQRRSDTDAEAFDTELQRANTDLAAAHAADNGWEPARIEAAARAAFDAEQPGMPIDALTLVQVIDPPGTDDDKVVYELVCLGQPMQLTLGRRGDDWHLESLR